MLNCDGMAGKLSIIMFSGTADKFIPLGVLSQAATAMGMEMNIFVTGFALVGFVKGKSELPFPVEFQNMAPKLIEGMKKNNVAPWYDMVKEAKGMGAHIYACSMMSGVMGLSKNDFDPIVEDIVGAATFLQKAEGGQTLFI
jgi:peroxiredoxin family protein